MHATTSSVETLVTKVYDPLQMGSENEDFEDVEVIDSMATLQVDCEKIVEGVTNPHATCIEVYKSKI